MLPIIWKYLFVAHLPSKVCEEKTTSDSSLNLSELNLIDSDVIYPAKNLLETKGDDRDNPDSASKRRLGNKWADLSGKQFHYFMVYDKISPDDAYNRTKAKELIAKL